MFRLHLQSSSVSANAQHPGCFCPWTFPFNIGLHLLPSDDFVSCLDYLLIYPTGKFQALQLIVRVLFGAVDWPLALCMLFHFLEIEFEMIMGLQSNFFMVFVMFHIYINASQCDNTQLSFTLFSCLNQCFIFTLYFSTRISRDVVLTLHIESRIAE